MNTTEKIASLRRHMSAAGYDALIIPQADPHMSEYLAPHWQLRRWLSGFTGSAGDLVVTADKALLWTDSRYFLQAAQQLEGSGIELMKDGLPDTPSISGYLCDTLEPHACVAIDDSLFSCSAFDTLEKALKEKEILLSTETVADGDWLDRPALPDAPIYIHEARYAGRTAVDKIGAILAIVHAHGQEAIFISALDDIAWTLNLRSDDVRHTPVFTAYLFLSEGKKILFTDLRKVDATVRAYLAEAAVELRDYTAVFEFLDKELNLTTFYDVARTNAAIRRALGHFGVAADFSPAAQLKSIKNESQIAGIRKAMERDGAALVRSFMEIEKRLADGVTTTETDVAEILRRHRSAAPEWRDESFGTIAGYGPHGAIVHYEADEESASTLRPEGLLLVDSGAQYLDGTTDITRTIALGTPTAQEKRDFTLVMKGHICLGSITFPEGTRGTQLDALARQFLWREGMSYLHGTGHGVGHFLGVHEGPQRIALIWVDVPMQPGMLTSNEPGLYRAGVHGIRCENLVLCHEAFTNEFGRFLKFETVTLFPFDLSLFDTSIMTDAEIAWLNDYHAMVRERLTLYLNDAEAAWLAAKTAKLTR